jgi:dTDP-D-glucose 4,6-dehydratase
MEFENLDFERALVTGGAGFVGSHLVEKLSSSNVQVIVLDNLSTGFESNLNHLLSTELIKGDVRNPKDVQIAATKDIDIVFHLAEYIPNAEGHVIKSSTEDPDMCRRHSKCFRGMQKKRFAFRACFNCSGLWFKSVSS